MEIYDTFPFLIHWSGATFDAIAEYDRERHELRLKCKGFIIILNSDFNGEFTYDADRHHYEVHLDG